MPQLPCFPFGRSVALLAAAIAFSPSALPAAGAVRTQLIQTAGGTQFLRDGQPYFVKGVGWPNDYPAAQLAGAKAHGANSIRTWGAGADIRALLDEAARQGLSVSFGIWLEHARHDFDYNNVDDVARQFAEVRRLVTEFKDHPAILVWGLGNEMEEFPPPGRGAPGEDAAIWSHIQALAGMVKTIDPNHPVMTTIAELGGRKVATIHRLCPDIDLIGINAYSRVGTVAERYRAAGGTKPFLLTEYGPRGHWECALTPWKAVREATSTDKAAEYRAGWTAIHTAAETGSPCLGGYAFIWGHKQEATATWFGLLLDTGEHLGAVDALEELWTGRAPSNRAPELKHLAWTTRDEAKPGAPLGAALTASDPEGAPLRVRWVVRAETPKIKIGGDREDPNPEFPDAVLRSSDQGATVRAPQAPGPYRLFVYVYDGHGGAATGNLPFLVK